MLQQDESQGHLNAKSDQSPASRKKTEVPAWIMPACGLESDLERLYLLALILKSLNPGYLTTKYQTRGRAVWV